MRTFVFLFLLTSICFCQTVFTENFNNFGFDTTGMSSYYKFGRTSDTVDVMGNANQGRFNVMVDSFEASPFISGEKVRYLNGTSDGYLTNNAALTPANDFTWVFRLKITGVNFSNMILDMGVSRAVTWAEAGGSPNYFFKYVASGPTTYSKNPVYTITDNQWHTLVYRKSSSLGEGLSIYDNGVQVDSISHLTDCSYQNNQVSFFVEHFTNSRYLNGRVSEAALFNKILTAREISQLGNLASGWVSKNGKVIHNPGDFFQTFFDTIGVPIAASYSLLGGKKLKLTLRAKSSDATKSLKVWIGRNNYARTTVNSKSVSSTWLTYSFQLEGIYALSTTDTLFFASSSLSDTLSIDNIKLKIVNKNRFRNLGFLRSL